MEIRSAVEVPLPSYIMGFRSFICEPEPINEKMSIVIFIPVSSFGLGTFDVSRICLILLPILAVSGRINPISIAFVIEKVKYYP